MRRILFLVSHYCSGSGVLYDSLDLHPRVQGFRDDRIVYENTQSLFNLTTQPHKLDNASAIYMDELLANPAITSKTIYPECRYIFVLRDAEGTLNEIVSTRNFDPRRALTYYLMRLRRMYSIARFQPDSVLLTFSDLEAGRGVELVSDYLGLREPLQKWSAVEMGLDNAIPLDILNDASAGFEYWLWKLKELGLRRC